MLINKLFKTAFTLIELLVVIAIIGILSGLIVISMSGVTNKANIAKAQIFSNSLRNSLMADMIAEYKFEGDATNSWGDSEGTAYGPTYKTSSECLSGQCINFDGIDDYVDISNVDNLKSSTGTISIWFKWTIGDVNVLFSLIDKDTAQLDSMQLGLGNWTGGQTDESVGFLYRDASIYKIIGYYKNGTYTYRDNNWHNIVMTVGENYNKMYFDGKEVDLTYSYGSSSVGGYFSQNTNIDTAEIGARLYNITTRDTYFGGSIDDLRIYDIAIPISQIKEQYYAGLNKLLISGNISSEEYVLRINNNISYE